MLNLMYYLIQALAYNFRKNCVSVRKLDVEEKFVLSMLVYISAIISLPGEREVGGRSFDQRNWARFP